MKYRFKFHFAFNYISNDCMAVRINCMLIKRYNANNACLLFTVSSKNTWEWYHSHNNLDEISWEDLLKQFHKYNKFNNDIDDFQDLKQHCQNVWFL